MTTQSIASPKYDFQNNAVVKSFMNAPIFSNPGRGWKGLQGYPCCQTCENKEDFRKVFGHPKRFAANNFRGKISSRPGANLITVSGAYLGDYSIILDRTGRLNKPLEIYKSLWNSIYFLFLNVMLTQKIVFTVNEYLYCINE